MRYSCSFEVVEIVFQWNFPLCSVLSFFKAQFVHWAVLLVQHNMQNHFISCSILLFSSHDALPPFIILSQPKLPFTALSQVT